MVLGADLALRETKEGRAGELFEERGGGKVEEVVGIGGEGSV